MQQEKEDDTEGWCTIEDKWQTQRQEVRKDFPSYNKGAGRTRKARDEQLTWVLGSATDEGLV